MMPNNISATTLWIIIGFLLITLILGLYTGRGIKDIKEYALGDGRFSTFTLTLTFLATYIGAGSIVGVPNEIYSFGIIAGLACFGWGIQDLILSFVTTRLSEFKNFLTLGDIMQFYFNTKVKILTGLLSFFHCIFMTALQLVMIGKILEVVTGINSFYAILVTSLILCIYSTTGGIKSVTMTDVLQFLILIVVIPLIASAALKKIGGYKQLYFQLPSTHLSIFNNKKFYYYLSCFLSWSIFPHMLTSPPLIQRMLMASTGNQLKNKFLVSAVFDSMLRIAIIFIGLSAIILCPNIKTNLITLELINKLFSNDILKGLAISGVLAVIISSIDSFMHTGGLVISNDILKPLFKNQNSVSELKIARFSTIFIAIGAVFLSINVDNIMSFRGLSMWAIKSTVPILLFPILFSIIGLKPSLQSFFLSALTGVFSFTLINFMFPIQMKMLALPISTFSSGVFYILVHLLQNKGIAWIERIKEEKEEEKLWIPNPEKILNKLINSIPTPRKIYNYSKYQVMKNGSQNIVFGIYACINFTLPYFLWDHQDTEKYNLMTNLRLIGGILAGLLIVKDQWKEFLKRYYPLYWHITLTYCLPFITTVMFLLTGGSTSWLLNVGTSIFFLIMLVTGEVFLILAPLGVGLAIAFYKFYIGPINLSSLGFDINYYLIYQLLFSTIIGLLFAYRKRIFNIIQGDIGLNLGSALCHELRNTLYSLTCNQYNRIRMERIEQEWPKVIEGEESYIISKQLFASFLDQTNQAINFDEDTLKVIKTFERIFKDYRKSITKPSVCSMKSVIEYTLKELHFLPGQKEKIKLNLIDDFYIKIPKSAFAFVVSNIIRNAFKHGRATKVEIKLENHQLKIRDNGVGIPPSKLEKIFKMHYTTGQEDSTGIGLGFAKLIVESIYGEIWCESEQGENSYSEFIIKFPEVSPSEITRESFIEIKEDSKKEGKKIQQEKIAIKMLEEGEEIKKIETYTELKRSEIQELKKLMGL